MDGPKETGTSGSSLFMGIFLFNLVSFLANVSILYSQKAPKNQRFSGVFRVYEMEISARNG